MNAQSNGSTDTLQWDTPGTDPVPCDIAKAESAGDKVVLSFGTVNVAAGGRMAQLVRQIPLTPAVADNLRAILRKIQADGTLRSDQLR